MLAFERASVAGRASQVGGDLDFTTVYAFAGRKISRIQVFLDRGEAIQAVGLPARPDQPSPCDKN